MRAMARMRECLNSTGADDERECHERERGNVTLGTHGLPVLYLHLLNN